MKTKNVALLIYKLFQGRGVHIMQAKPMKHIDFINKRDQMYINSKNNNVELVHYITLDQIFGNKKVSKNWVKAYINKLNITIYREKIPFEDIRYDVDVTWEDICKINT